MHQKKLGLYSTSARKPIANPIVDDRESFALQRILSSRFRRLDEKHDLHEITVTLVTREEVFHDFCKQHLNGCSLSEAKEDAILGLLRKAEEKGHVKLARQNDYGRGRFNSFLNTGFFVIKDNRYVCYEIEFAGGRTEQKEEDLYVFCRKFLDCRNFPTQMPEMDGNLSLQMFMAAESQGIIKVVRKNA